MLSDLTASCKKTVEAEVGCEGSFARPASLGYTLCEQQEATEKL